MRDEIDQLRTFRAGTPDPDAPAWSRAERAIAEARRRQGSGWRRAWRRPGWRMLTALSALPVLAFAVLLAVTLSAAPTASRPAATPGAGLTWSLAGYFAPGGYQLNTQGPAPGSLTCPTATTCYVQADEVFHRVGGALDRNVHQWDSLYVSSDGARTWKAIPLPDGLAFTSRLVCQSADSCSAGVLEHGTAAFAFTGDGGRTWTTSPLPAGTVQISMLSCPAATTCRALTETGKEISARLVTTDDGRHFTVTSFPTRDRISQLSCPTASHCIAEGTGTAYDTSFTGLVLVSEDGGATWRLGTLPRAMSVDTGAVDCVNAERCFEFGLRTLGTPSYHSGVLNGITKQYDEMLLSDDGGLSWTARPLPASFPSPLIDGVACVSFSTCYITGSDSVPQYYRDTPGHNGTSAGSDFAAVTQDAGLTWQAMTLAEPPTSQLRQFELPVNYMELSSLQCPQVNVCIALASNTAGNSHAAIYTTAP